MQNKTEKQKPHSETFFGEVRDYWWNRDYLELTAKRLELNKVQNALDVGSGIGHWGQLLLPLLAPEARLTGVDREPLWIERARERAKKNSLAEQCTYQLGDANSLPFSDEVFDLVTCQTVLIHLPDPKHAIGEMIRVLKPGGLLLVTEPNNQANGAVGSNLTHEMPVDEVMESWRFHLMCDRGKKALGLGYISLGDLVPGYFARQGLQEVQVYLNDKANPLFAPYASPEQQADIKQIESCITEGTIGWDREETFSYFIAGGGTPEAFNHQWILLRKRMQSFLTEVQNGHYHSAGGGVSYLISGRKKM